MAVSLENQRKVNEMFTLYEEFSAADRYMLGFIDGANVCYKIVTADILFPAVKIDSASSGSISKKATSKKCIKFKPTKSYISEYLKDGCQILCTLAELENARAGKYNYGEAFEKVAVEKLTGRTWKKDKTDFWTAPDFEYQGMKIQAKFEKATIANEYQLTHLRKVGGKVIKIDD